MNTACQVNDPEKGETESTRSPARRAALILVLASLASAPSAATPQGIVSKYQPLEVFFITPLTAPGNVPLTETTPSPNNPWLDYRCDVTFTHVNGTTHVVPGYYAGDGSFGSSGSVWAARFAPFGANALGTWAYSAQIWRFNDANITPKLPAPASSPLWTSGPSGSVTCVAPTGIDLKFLRYGFLRATGDRYLEFDDPAGGHFLMTGVGGPENFLASPDFTGWALGPAADCFGNPENSDRLTTGHDYAVHEANDWMGEPTWGASGTLGRGLIGAINYLHDVGLNSLYFMPMNLGGDGRDVFPFSAPGFYITPCSPNPTTTVFHYSVPRMREWNIVFEHAMRRDVLLNFVLAEREEGNINWLGGAESTGVLPTGVMGMAMSRERKLYLKQMVAYFAHNVAIKWNLCEENYPAIPLPDDFRQFNSVELRDLAEWLGSWDVYDHPRTVHTEANGFSAYQDLLSSANDDWLDVTSLQVHGENIGPTPNNTVTHQASTSYSYYAQQARKLFQNHINGGRTVVVDIDENGSGWRGAAPLNWTDPQNTWVEADRHDRRRRILYDVLFAGANLSWYLGNYAETEGGGDINIERFFTREDLFEDTADARKPLEMPDFNGQGDLFVEMQPWDEVVAQSGTGAGQLLTSPPAGFHPMQDTEGLDVGAYDGEFGRPRVFAMMNGRVLVHYPHLAAFGPYIINLDPVRSSTNAPMSYTSYWYNPRSGMPVLPRTVFATNFGAHVPPLPNVTLQAHEDWVYIIEAN